jgi:hypothetical protein
MQIWSPLVQKRTLSIVSDNDACRRERLIPAE